MIDTMAQNWLVELLPRIVDLAREAGSGHSENCRKCSGGSSSQIQAR